MGLELAYLTFIERCAKAHLGDLRGRSMLELGNQKVMPSAGAKERTGRKYFGNRGVHHVSVDLNGKDGALALDLSERIDRPDWHHHFDIITNVGTTEHVEPLAGQYDCFANLHSWLRVGGIAIHIVPSVEQLDLRGCWAGHCNNYYSRKFFQDLAGGTGCALVATEFIWGNIGACLLKETDVPFVPDRDAFLAGITRKEGGIVYEGINDGTRSDGARRKGASATWVGRLLPRGARGAPRAT